MHINAKMHLYEALMELMRLTDSIYKNTINLSLRNGLRKLKTYDEECCFVKIYSNFLTDIAIAKIRSQQLWLEEMQNTYSMTDELDDNKQLDVSNLRNGIYFIKMKNESFSIEKKIIIEH